MEQGEQGGKKGSAKTIIMICALVLVLAGGIAVGANFNKMFGKQTAPETAAQSSAAPGIELDENAQAWDGQIPTVAVTSPHPESIEVPGYGKITIAKDTTAVQMPLHNPEGNPCYFKFTIVLDDTGETIFESKYVAPGDAVKDVTLTRPLTAGEYNATIQISTVGLDQTTPMNGANMATVLKVV